MTTSDNRRVSLKNEQKRYDLPEFSPKNKDNTY